MKSFKRLKCLSEAVNELIKTKSLENITIADIGSDHGYLAEILARNEKISKVIASDISEDCLNKTKKLIYDNNLTKIETRLGDGLKPFDKVDIAVLAGLGGYEIINIISYQNISNNNDIKARYFVLMPSQNTLELREWIFKNNIGIIRDYIVESCNRFYSILVIDVEMCNKIERSDFNLFFGKDNKLENPDFIGFLKFQIEYYNFFDKLTKQQIELDEMTKKKYKIYTMAKDFLKEKQGD